MANKPIPPLDAMFFLTESPQSPKHIGVVQVFELPPRAPDSYLRDLVAELKQAQVVAPFSYTPHFPRLGMPQWHAGDELEIDYHIRHSALPGPGTTGQLMEEVQRLHAGLLNRRRPCWICQFIEGLENNRFAIYFKIHHSYIDGMSGVKRMYGSLSTSPRDQTVTAPWSFELDRSDGKPRAGAKRTNNKLLTQARGAMQAYEFLTRMGLQLLNLRDGKAQVPFAASRTLTNRPIEWESRSTAVCTLQLDRVKAIGRKRHCTLNEVVLAVIGAALQDYLEQHQETLQAPLVALCPMSIRSRNDDSASTQVSAVHVRLGEPGAAIADRLDQVIESSHASKDEVSDLSSEAMMDYGVFLFAVYELLERSGLGQHVAPSYNVLVSNVPGPGEENLYLCGSRLVASYPISTLLPGVNLNATLLSHGNSLDFGLLGDRHALPDLELMVQRMEHHFCALEQAVLGKRRKTGRKKSTGKAKRKSTARSKGGATGKSRTRPKKASRSGAKRSSAA